MGWTLFACFGYTKKRKRPKTGSNFGSKSRRRIRGYEPLQSEAPEELDVSQPLGSPRENPKDEKKARIRKKVRFNLEVVTYEPLSSQDDEHYNSSEERGGDETDQAEAAAAAAEDCLIYAPVSKTVSTETKLPPFSSNYRYNSYDGEDGYEYDEDDDYECQISDDEEDDDNDDYDNDEEEDDGCIIGTQNLYYEKLTEELRDGSSLPLISSATNARLRSHYIVPVLNPIENLSQWKTVKSKKC